MDGNFEDDFASMTIFIGFPGPEEPERYAADAQKWLDALDGAGYLEPTRRVVEHAPEAIAPVKDNLFGWLLRMVGVK